MSTRVKGMVLLLIIASLGWPNSVFASAGFKIRKGDSFQTRAITLERSGRGSIQHPAGSYSFKILGIDQPGVVAVRAFDSSGKLVGRTRGKFAGTCPGKPTVTTFAELGYTESSEVKTAVKNGVRHVTIECGQGSRIEFIF